MKNRKYVFFIILTLFLMLSAPAHAKSARGHLIKAGSDITSAVYAPFEAIFITGPKKIKDVWNYEVNNREKPEKRGLFRYKAFSVWRAPGCEAKALIDGCVKSITKSGDAVTNLISIFFSD